jgi:hypothetical protein
VRHVVGKLFAPASIMTTNTLHNALLPNRENPSTSDIFQYVPENRTKLLGMPPVMVQPVYRALCPSDLQRYRVHPHDCFTHILNMGTIFAGNLGSGNW